MKKILGSMTFGDPVSEVQSDAIIGAFLEAGGGEIDSANLYGDGATETLLGAVLPTQTKPVYLASKVHPWNDEGLQPQQVKRQLAQTLERLGRDSVDLLYLHSPDLDTPIEQTLEACFELYQQGRFRDFGLSNFASWQVAEIVELCRRHGWIEPRVYQGMYNALTRDVERELFPCLRHYDMAFYAYNPLAGGLLTGRYTSVEKLPDAGRFVDRDNYLERYWKQEYFDALQVLFEACAARGIDPTRAAFSWLVNHSLLDADAGDGVILGVSKMEHLQANLAACEQPPLDDDIVALFERGWQLVKPDCFRYFRP